MSHQTQFQFGKQILIISKRFDLAVHVYQLQH